MIELLTGTPGSFKTATAVLDICMKVPGSFVEAQDKLTSHGVEYEKGDKVPRHLFANIKGLLVEHTPIDDDAMRTWHQWAQPGDVIVFDEAQTLWRPRAVGSKVPEEIQALETHRHMGIDLIPITQHPMLVDANLRRLVNKHRHLRRLPGGMVMEYEWDHCGQPGSYKTCIRTGLRRAPAAAFPMYRSATLHTKPKTNIPAGLLGVLAVALGVAAWQGPQVYDRLFKPAQAQPVAAKPAEPKPVPLTPAPAASAPVVAAIAPPPREPASAPKRLSGCMEARAGCRCFDEAGEPAEVEDAVCRARLPQGGKPIDLTGFAREVRQPVQDVEQQARDLDVWRSLQAARDSQVREVGFRMNGRTPPSLPVQQMVGAR